MNNKILIISLEGAESNTEINFFNGIGYYFDFIHAIPLGKQGRTTRAKKSFEQRFDAQKISFPDNKTLVNIFFIGDGDIKQELKLIEETIEPLSKMLKDYYDDENIDIHNKLIFEGNKSFDDVLNNNKIIKDSGIIGPQKIHKKASNIRLFNNIIELFYKKIDEAKCIEILESIFKNTSYTKIIDIIKSIFLNNKR